MGIGSRNERKIMEVMSIVFRNTTVILTILGLSALVYGQNVVMGDVGYLESNPADCNTFGVAGTNFVDDGNAANYSANFNDTTVFCPNLNIGTKMSMSFGINAGYEFDVDGSDSIYVYDGPNTSAPLLGVHNSVTDPIGFSHTASWNNPSGCLTVVFISDGAVEGTGWVANVACGNQNQPFNMSIVAYINGVGPDALNPADTGFVDICFEDSILFIAQPTFPYSQENTGYGYSQTLENVDYDWYITSGLSYPNNDSVWFVPPSRNGFLVDLKITDAFPQIERMLCKIRVSQLPSFATTGPLEDTICLGSTTTLIGGVTSIDTAGVNIPAGTFQLGGSFAGLTYLPDGSGAQYNAPIDIQGFPVGSTISNSQDLNQVCITMEHSYLGDLEIALECPNGTQVTLLNSYNPGFIPLGTSGGGTYLGDPIDDFGGGGPGQGWEYCFSSVFNTWGDYPTEYGLGNTIPAPIFGNNGPSMNPNGVYLPEEDFATFIGCPVNGQWTIIVQDNLTVDDGYIFEWGLFFDPSFFPGTSGYQNTIVSADWLSDPTIISGQSDTAIVVQPSVTGDYPYTFVVTDDYGCVYDTTVSLNVVPGPDIFDSEIGCNFAYQVSGTSSFAGGVWAAADTAVHFNPDVNTENPSIWTSTPGVYDVTYTDNYCNLTQTGTIDFPPYPWTWLVDTVLCNGVTMEFTALDENTYPTSYQWNNGETGNVILISEPGEYIVTLSNVCHTNYDTMIIDYKLCDIVAPNVLSLSQGTQNPLWYVQAEGLSSFNLVITNRWGNVVYSCSEEPAECYWDGRSPGGTLVEEGTYFYIIDAVIEGGEPLQKHGFIQVVH